MDGRLETLPGDALVRREAQDRATAGRDPEQARRVVERPQPRLGGVRREGQALLAVLEDELVSPAREGVGEDLRHELEALDHDLRPVALRPQRVEGQRAHERLASHGERDGQVRLDAGDPRRLPVDRALRWHVVQGREDDDAAGQHLPQAPGVLQVDLRLRSPASTRAGRSAWARSRPPRPPATARARRKSISSNWHTRPSASSIARSTSPGGRLMKREERSEISVSNSSRVPRCTESIEVTIERRVYARSMREKDEMSPRGRQGVLGVRQRRRSSGSGSTARASGSCRS